MGLKRFSVRLRSARSVGSATLASPLFRREIESMIGLSRTGGYTSVASSGSYGLAVGTLGGTVALGVGETRGVADGVGVKPGVKVAVTVGVCVGVPVGAITMLRSSSLVSTTIVPTIPRIIIIPTTAAAMYRRSTTISPSPARRRVLCVHLTSEGSGII